MKMVLCFVPGCNHRSENKKCSFLKFPKEKEKRKRWIDAVRRADTLPVDSSKVCSCHFQDATGIPNKFLWNEGKKIHFLTPEKHTRKKRKAVPNNDDVIHEDQSVAVRTLFVGENDHVDQVDARTHAVRENEAGSLNSGTDSDSIQGLTSGIAHLQCDTKLQTNFCSNFIPLQSICEPQLNSTVNIVHRRCDAETQTSPNIVHTGTQTTHMPQDILRCDAETQTSPNVVHTGTQTTHIPQELEESIRQSQLEELSCEVVRLKQRCIGFFRITDDGLCRCYTGLNLREFKAIVEVISGVEFQYVEAWTVERLSLEDQLLMTLMKLRQALKNKDLACRFGVSTATVHNIINTFLIVLHECLYKVTMREIPKRSRTKTSLPQSFIGTYENCRIIIDCTEIRCAVPHKLSEQKSTYSNYKKYHSLKALVAVAPNGTLVYVSDLYPGNTSDKAIVSHCRIMEQMEPGDVILADKGFLINDITPRGVSVNLPPFAPPGGQQFSPEEIAECENIASRRIHVERIIQRIKTYNILNFIPKKYFELSSVIFQVCAALVNFQSPILKECAKFFQS